MKQYIRDNILITKSRIDVSTRLWLIDICLLFMRSGNVTRLSIKVFVIPFIFVIKTDSSVFLFSFY